MTKNGFSASIVESRNHCRAAEIDDSRCKPINKETLKSAVQKWQTAPTLRRALLGEQESL
jgi:hypothetical protein